MVTAASALIYRKNIKELYVSRFDHAGASPQNRIKLFFLRSLGAVFGAGLKPVSHAGGIKSASDDVISYARKVLYSAASDENNAVFLEVMADSRNVSGHFNTVGQTNSGNFSQS